MSLSLSKQELLIEINFDPIAHYLLRHAHERNAIIPKITEKTPYSSRACMDDAPSWTVFI